MHLASLVADYMYLDPAAHCARQGRVLVHCYELGIQFPCRRDDSDIAGNDRVAVVPDARILLCLQFHSW